MQQIETPSCKPANENRWYLLATLHGEPTGLLAATLASQNDAAHKNRESWNRWMAAGIDDVERERLIATGRYSRLDLTPLTPTEHQQWQELFLRRAAKSKTSSNLPSPMAEIDLSKTRFEADFDFKGYVFPNHLNADRAIFKMFSPFSKCDFLRMSSFEGAQFLGEVVYLSNNNFQGSANFGDSYFTGATSFLQSVFHGCSFKNVTFQSHVDFFFVLWNDFCYFSNAKFMDAAIFDNSEFKMRLSFNSTQFIRPPIFLNSKLPEGLDLSGVRWPIVEKHTEKPLEFVQAYQKLKAEMDRQKLHEDELMFFGYEMQARGAAKSKWGSMSFKIPTSIEMKRSLNLTLYGPGDGLLIPFYEALSDYGRSYTRPLGWLILLVFLFWPFNAMFGMGAWEALGLSFVDTFRIFGIRDEFFTKIPDLPMALRVFAALQTVIGSALLFLFLLALQKKFRMK